MLRRQPSAALAAVLAGLTWTRAAALAPDDGAEIRARAADLVYNLDHAEAAQLLRKAVNDAPDIAANHRALASAIWLDILYRRGAVTVDHYLGAVSKPRVDLKKPPPDLDAEFKREVARAIDLARQRVTVAPNDAQAHFDLGTALGLEASYMASVEGRLTAGFSAARRSYDEQEKVLQLDPSRKEAGLVIGTYRYLVSTLSLPMRWMAYMAGFGGGKERGLKMIEEAAGTSSDNRTDAQFALVLLYNREKRFDDALRVLGELKRRYPRNRLVLLEAGATASRAGRGAQAEAMLNEGLERFASDQRPKIPGEAALWHYKRGVARAQLDKRDAALSDLRAATSPDAAGWVQGRARVEIAKIALRQGDRTTARNEAAQALQACQNDNDAICVEEAKRIR
jgi:tetratricopeptide (TPR) repeat protein